jgi:hypothetical protein
MKKRSSGARRSSGRSSETESSGESPEGSTMKNSEASAPSDSRTESLLASSPANRKPAKRNIPVAIRRAVWTRDGGHCAYQSQAGRSCGSRETIEFHHRVPWARCKEHMIDNIALRCRAHNQYEAVLDFGEAHMARFRKGISEGDPKGIAGRNSRRANDLGGIGRRKDQLDPDPVRKFTFS